MENIFTINNIVGAFINAFGYIYVWAKLSENRLNLKSFKHYTIHILFTIFLILNYVLVSDVVRILLLVTVMGILFSILFKESIVQGIVIGFVSQIIMMIAELIFIFVVSVIFKVDTNLLIQSYFVKIGSNLVISIIAILIVRLKFVHKFYNFIVKIAKNLKEYNVIFMMLIILMSINFIFASIYNKINLTFVVIMNSIISSIYLIICYKFIKAENKYYKINSKYNTTINSLKEYEEILDAYRVSNHENKNELLTIRSMIVKKEKNIPKYIDKIIDNKIKDDEKLMFDTNTIPAGGLRAVIYSKMLYMKENKINFKLNVDRKVRTVQLIELGEDLMLDVCKIIGVFLDNAIEAVRDLNDKNINIHLATDNNYLFVEISNNFEGKIDIDKLDNKGYTSKSRGHGYGLTLVRDILSQNGKLKNERKINKNTFSQKLKIRIK